MGVTENGDLPKSNCQRQTPNAKRGPGSIICHLSSVMVAPAGNARSHAEHCQPGRPWYTPRFVCQNRLMPISRICLFAGLFAFASSAIAQEASPSPSAPTKPFVVDQTGAEKELKKEKGEKNVTPTPTPDLRFPSNPIAPSTPAPQANSSSNYPGVPYC